MKSNAELASARFDWAKWLVIALIGAGAVWGNLHFSAEPVFIRGFVLLLVGGVATVLALWTSQGAAALQLALAAKTEIRKVVWPTRQETTQTTLIVVAVVVVMALLLWGLDTFLGWLASMLIG